MKNCCILWYYGFLSHKSGIPQILKISNETFTNLILPLINLLAPHTEIILICPFFHFKMQFLCIPSYRSHESLHFNSSYPVLHFWWIWHSLPSNIHRLFSCHYCWSPSILFSIHVSLESFDFPQTHKPLPPPFPQFPYFQPFYPNKTTSVES